MATAKKTLVGELESYPPIPIYEVTLTMTEGEARILAEEGKILQGPSVSSTIDELLRLLGPMS